MRKLLSLGLALIMCWSVACVAVPELETAAVETGNATLTGERYTVDWTIPEIGNANVGTDVVAGSPTELTALSYEILGFVSPKYPDNRAIGADKTGENELTDDVLGSNHYLNDPWVGIYGNEQNGIIIDLGYYYTNLSTISLNMLCDPELGIFLPSTITVASSSDGVSYNKVGTFSSMIGTDSAGNTVNNSSYFVPEEYASVTYDVTFDNGGKLFKGQYLLLVFDHEKGSDGFDRCWTFISEFSVFTGGEIVMEDFSNVEAMSTYNKPTGDTYEVQVALNSTYQIIGSISTGNYADTNRSELTDGVDKGSNDLSDPNTTEYVAISPTDNQVRVQIDLGTSTSNISSIGISGLGGSSSSYSVPGSIDLYGSEDGETYYKVGMATLKSTASGSVYELKLDVSDNKAFTSRYLTFVINTTGAILIDEVMVYTTNASTTVQNIAVADGVQYKYLINNIDSSFNDEDWTGAQTNGIPTLGEYGTGDLNNGISATGSFLDPAWVGYNYTAVNGDYVEIVFNLGSQVSGINKVNFKLLEYTNSSTITPSSVPAEFTVFYSNNETSYSTSSSVKGACADTLVVNSSSTRQQKYHTYVAEPNSVTAQYIMIRIPKNNKELHIDEIQIWTGDKDPTETVEAYTPLNYDTISGVWFDCFTITDLYLLQGVYQVDEQTFRERASNYVTAMANAGINTIMLHTRSHSDALYGSYDKDFTPDDDSTTSISPYSKRYTGSNYAISTYDAFEVFLDVAHEKGLSVHAWINPLRMGVASDLDTFDDSYAVKQFYNGNYNGETHSDYSNFVGSYYWLNIGYEEVRLHIVDAVMEIVNNYNIDAIIMDDYFYPADATTAFDAECYANYSANAASPMSLANWRRENTNMLVRSLYKAIETAKPDVLYGISPAGNISNYTTSYNYATMYADVKKWCEETWEDDNGTTYKYMDYISPQMYWAPDSQFMYDTGSTRWISGTKYNVMAGYLTDWCAFDYVDGVELVVSLGLYRNFDTTIGSEYINNNVILDQLQLMREYLFADSGKKACDSSRNVLKLVSGQIMYRSHNLYNDFTSTTGYCFNTAFTEARSLAVRNELIEYWRGTLMPN